MTNCRKNGFIIILFLALSGCNKIYTPADFMKDDSLRNSTLARCEQQSGEHDKNCQNAYNAQNKIDFEKETGKAELK
ncbi:EexN family lipoprotein [Rosenbergiella australiborealis]|uniref:EexN family lipoprotein n=1 Tax=Rosenbergiella australiborealis TaxID=1544696 RepID=UPI001F4D42BD|nr:EexN family lipoprotein [Rosenbergiella australiborealis]